MNSINNWDWNTGRRMIADIGEWKTRYQWVEEPYVSPEGEKIAAVVKPPEDEVFTICENGTLWESTFDKVWYPRFSPDGKLTALVSETGEWGLAIDGQISEEKYEFAWDTRFSSDGANIIHMAQRERKYFVAINNVPWETGFPSMTGLVVSNDGSRTAAAVQTVLFKEAEIFKFQEGCYSVAVDGTAWGRNFVNVWDVVFSPDGKRVAAGIRTSLYDYTVAVDGIPWEKS
ncbi:MAG: WD40 repeat domain-containing protein, partial [Desulfobacterales bacterium]|nr:WD40 repeat domain-containing protein [Desulfobacterales bacterium]